MVVKGILHQKIFYRLNLIFWIVLKCGVAHFARRGLKTTETRKFWSQILSPGVSRRGEGGVSRHGIRGFEARNQGFRGTESGVSRHGIRGFEARNQGFQGAATPTEHLSASSFPAVPQGPIWRGGVSRGGGTIRISVLYHFLLTVPKH